MHKVIVALFTLLICFAAHANVKPGDTAPDDLGKARNGQSITVSSLHGKVVVISFWATWCKYCLKEMPVLAGLQSLASQRQLSLQVVSIDSREARETFVHAARMLQPKLPGLVLSWDRDGKIGKPYGANEGIPVMVMLHRDGTIAQIHVGYGEEMLDTIVEEINALLAEPAPAPSVAIAR
jgi:thiol-disulfide isomerase/thioredoxin